MMPLIQVHIADIHFGAIDAQKQYQILEEQFLNQISKIGFDILSIDGDLFDRKFMANSAAVYYATMFVHRCAMLCQMRNAAFIMISGTESHEAGQLSLFKDLNSIFSTEIHVVECAQFIYTHGIKILCLPEEYDKGYDYYAPLLNQSYDMCFMHGTIVGGVYGANKEDIDARRPVFGLEAFAGCKGPIIAGHVHQAMCLQSYMYYISNPIRYKFGEEAEKGYAIVLSNEYGHFYQFMPIQSFRYDTISVAELGVTDPDQIVQRINALQASGIDHIRLVCSGMSDLEQKTVSQYFMQNSTVKVETEKSESNSPKVDTTQEILDKYKGMEFLLDPSLDEYQKLSRFISFNLGHDFITAEELKQIITGGK